MEIIPNSRDPRPEVLLRRAVKGQKPKKVKSKSRVSNGTELLPGVDGRTSLAKRYRDIASQIIVDQGGEDRLAEARLQLIRRFSAAAVLAEQMEARMVLGEQIDINLHALLTSSLVRVASKIGINRRAKEIVPTLKHYLEVKADEDEDDDGDPKEKE